MRAFISGGAGFLGSHLADQLVLDGHHVTVLDDFSTGRMENLANHGEQLDVICGSTSNKGLVSEVVSESDHVYHLASPVGVMYVMQRPSYVVRSMLDGMANVIAACVDHDKPLLFTSSSEVYGTDPAVPTPETAPVIMGSPESVRWHYAAGKAANEHQVLAAYQEYNLKAVVVRLFNVAGARQSGRYGMVVPRFVWAALAGEVLTVYGHGLQTRSFAHVADVVDGLVALAGCEKAVGEIVNLGSGVPISINNLAKQIIEATGSQSVIDHVPHSRAYGERFQEVVRRTPDLRKAKRLVGYDPKRTLADIIQSMVVEREEHVH